MPTITGLSAGGSVTPANIEIAGWDTAAAVPKTRKWTLATLLAGLTAPNFTTLRVASGSTISAVLKATGAVAVTSLATNAETTVTISVPGAAAGDLVVASPTATPTAGLTYLAWISATDTVSVKVRNHTGGDVTSSVAFAFLVLRGA